jgi:hypothetical protein
MSFLLSGEDLRAMQRAVGIWLPAFAYLDSAEQVAERDLNAVAELAEAFREATLAVEMVVGQDGAVAQYALSEGESGARGQMEALPRGLVRCTLVTATLIDAVAEVAALPVDASTDGPVWTVAAAAYNRCGDLAAAGDDEGAVAALAAEGVPESTAKAWVAALYGRGSSGAVTVVRRRPGRRLEAGELRWITDGFGGAWRIEPHAEADSGERPGEPVYAMSAVKGAGLYQALAELCGGQRA